MVDSREAIHFEVFRVECTPAMRCRLYDENGERLRSRASTFYVHHDIRPGDLVVKEVNSLRLEVYRKNDVGIYELLLDLDPR